MSDIGAVSASHRQVGFGEAVKLFFKNYVNFQGRSSRGAYWWYCLFALIVGLVLGVIDGLVFGGSNLLGNLFSLATLVPGIALSIRRLHDINKSGWWVLIALTIIGIILLIVWAIKPGDRAPNKFGPDVEAGK